MLLGVLDFGKIYSDNTAADVILETIECAQVSEKLGYIRYWLAEHYEKDIAWRRADIIINLLAGNTNNIIIGSAGVLLRYHSPFDIAQNYRTLSDIYFERIDLGFANGHSSEAQDKELLTIQNITEIKDQFLGKINNTLSYFKNEMKTIAVGLSTPNCWLLGGSKHSVKIAINNKLNYSHSLLHIGIDMEESINSIKLFKVEKKDVDLKCSIAISVFVSNDLNRIKEFQGKSRGIKLNICGTPENSISEFVKISEIYDPDEIIICNCGEYLEEKLLIIEIFAQFIK